MNYHYLSFSDLLLVDGFAEAFGQQDVAGIKDCLWRCGMDVNHEEKYEEAFVEHRNLQNHVVKCIRYSGYERTDNAWLKTGVASLAAIIASTPDLSLRRELRTMSKEIAQDQKFNGPMYEEV